jgi:hypothetical protein
VFDEVDYIFNMLRFIHSFLRKILLLLAALVVFSCNDELAEIDPTKAQLNIHVYALITNNPKENATVSVHLTEDDANNNVNPVVEKRFTDNNGDVTFRNLRPDRRYWIRAKVLIDTSVNQTDELEIGENYHEIGTL